MSITCPRCRYDNTETANFCVKCGAAISTVGSVAASAADSVVAPDPAGPEIAETPFGSVSSRPVTRRTPLPPPPPPIFTPNPLSPSVAASETPVPMDGAAVTMIAIVAPTTESTTAVPLVDKAEPPKVASAAAPSAVSAAVWIGALLAVASIAAFVSFISHNEENGKGVVQDIAIQSSLPACQGTDSKRWSNCLGTWFDPSKVQYVGEFKDGEFDGQGVLYFLSKSQNYGDKYVGQFKHNNFNGLGVFYFLNDGEFKGDKLVGEYKDGYLNGRGIQYKANGRIENSGIWKDGSIVRSEYVDPRSLPKP